MSRRTAEQLIDYERMGDTLAGSMVSSIERSKNVGLRRALIGLAIPHASEGVAKRLCLAGYERSIEETIAFASVSPMRSYPTSCSVVSA